MKAKLTIALLLALSIVAYGQQRIWALDALIANTVTSLGSILSSSSTAGIGYTTGAGGAVVQATSKSTTVTLNTVSGNITTSNAALAANTSVSFTVNNSTVAATDVIVLNSRSGGTANSYMVETGSVAAGSFTIHIRNVSAGSLSQALVINFVVIKGV